MGTVGIGLVALAMAVGVVGTVLPVVPGLWLVWAAALVFGLVDGFGAAGWVAFGVISLLAVAGSVAGVVIPPRAAGAAGAPRSSLLVGAVAAVAGFFVVPVVGLAVGGLLGVFAAEVLRTRDAGMAWRATLATVKGFGLAAVAQLAAGLAMVATWLLWLAA